MDTPVDLSPPSVQRMTLGTMQQRRETQQDIAMLEARLHGTTHGTLRSQVPGVEHVHDIDVVVPGFSATGDRELLELNMAHDAQLLHELTPPEVTEAQQRANEARIRELEAVVFPALLRDDELRSGSAGDVQRFIASEGSVGHVNRVVELRNRYLIRDRHSDDPFIRSIERFRKVKPPQYNPAAFRAGFEQIEMTPATTEETAALTDIAYLAFLQLKSEGREQIAIQQILSWSPRQYEVAMQRFRASTPAAPGAARAASEDGLAQSRRLRELRDAMSQAGISTYRLSRQLAMHSSTLHGWLSGKKQLTEAELTRLYDGVHTLLQEQLRPEEEAS